MVATGNAFALGAFESAVQRDAEVLGVLYTGSLGRGTADRYYDLDIELWVTDRAFADAPNVLRRLMGHLGAVQFRYERREAFTTWFVGPDWQRIDLALHSQTETELAASYATARIVKDVDGSLARSIAQVPQKTIFESGRFAESCGYSSIPTMQLAGQWDSRLSWRRYTTIWLGTGTRVGGTNAERMGRWRNHSTNASGHCGSSGKTGASDKVGGRSASHMWKQKGERVPG
jgi:hypothetical protein